MKHPERYRLLLAQFCWNYSWLRLCDIISAGMTLISTLRICTYGPFKKLFHPTHPKQMGILKWKILLWEAWSLVSEVVNVLPLLLASSTVHLPFWPALLWGFWVKPVSCAAVPCVRVCRLSLSLAGVGMSRLLPNPHGSVNKLPSSASLHKPSAWERRRPLMRKWKWCN